MTVFFYRACQPRCHPMAIGNHDSKGEHSLSKKCYIPNEQKVGTSRFSRVSKYAKRDGCHG